MIAWQTNELADSRVSYGIDQRNRMAGSIEYTLDHLVLLTNLTPNSTYSVVVASRDIAQNGPTASANFSLTTPVSGGTAAPSLSAAPEVLADENQAVITWSTDSHATTQLEYGYSADALVFKAGISGLETEHRLVLVNLVEATEYFYQVSSSDSLGREVKSAVGHFTTTGEPAQLSLAETRLTEGDSGSQSLILRFTLSRAVAETVQLSYATLDQSATAGSDYQASSGSLQFAPGETEKTVSITVLGDLIEEEDEVFLIQLSGLDHAVSTSNQVSATILDNDQVCISLTAQPVGASLCVGANLTLEVGASGSSLASNPTLYQWYRDGQLLNGATDASLDLSSVATSDAGTYVCAVSNHCNIVQSEPVLVEVSANPAQAHAGNDLVLLEIESATLAANSPQVGQGQWQVSAGPDLAASQFSATSDPSATFTPAGGPGAYTLVWTVASGACTPSSDSLVLTVLPTADLSLDLELSDANPSVGDRIEAHLTLANHGPSSATGLAVAVDLPEGLNYVSAQGSGSFNPQTQVWLPGDLGAQASASLVLTLELSVASALSLSAELAQAQQADPDSTPGNGATEDDRATAELTPKGFLVLSAELRAVLAARDEVDSYDDDLISPSEANAVTELNLDDTGIQDYTGLEQFTYLQVLSLRRNGIVRLPRLSALGLLRELDCSQNWLNGWADEEGAFCLPAGLVVLIAAENQLGQVPDQVAGLHQLEVVRLGQNQLTSLSPLIGALSQLRVLDLTSNQLSELPASIADLSALVELHLADNRLSALPGLDGLIHLERLSCSHNRLTQLPALANTAPLHQLTLQQNRLTEIDPLAGHPGLGTSAGDEIRLDHNWLTDSACPVLTELETRAQQSGAYLSYEIQGNFANEANQLPVWSELIFNSPLLEWVFHVTQQTNDYNLNCAP